jgi:ABC-type hemin transport system substrate-binding protein
VSLAPAATEFVVDLGAASALIAVDRESAILPGLASLPIVALQDARGLGPDLVLAPALRDEDAPAVEGLRALGSEVIEIAPRDYEAVFALLRHVGERLVGAVRTATFVSDLGRELGALSAASHGRRRPRVAALRAAEPLEPAPAHGFETDLIELAGGTSTAHDHDRPLPVTVAQLVATGPDLVLVVSPSALPEPARAAVRSALGDPVAIEFFVLDTQRFWARGGRDAVLRLRALIEPLSR